MKHNCKNVNDIIDFWTTKLLSFAFFKEIIGCFETCLIVECFSEKGSEKRKDLPKSVKLKDNFKSHIRDEALDLRHKYENILDRLELHIR